MKEFLNVSDFLRAFQSYHWYQIAIEWLLIGGVVFWVVRFLRGTRGAPLLKAIVLLLIFLYAVVGVLGQAMGLQRISFLYGKLLLVASFAVVVVFQPELRRALMRLGEAGPFRNRATNEIDALVEAAVFLSRRKIGALIAVERETGLGGIVESGTKVNAELSAALLNTIFWPNSPLHDLGVVIREGRIAYAGVQFPLAESGELEQELGSRHRAAVGMSQDSDAVVLVVSEETGDISVAERGQLIRKLSADGLRGLLQEMLGRPEGRASLRRAAA